MIPRPSLLIVTCAACLSLSARSVDAFQTPPILAKSSQQAKQPIWASPIVLGGVGAVVIVGAAAVVVLKRMGRAKVLEPSAPEFEPVLPNSNHSALKPNHWNDRSETLLQPEPSDTLTQVVEKPTPDPPPKIEETTRLVKVSIVDELVRDLRAADPAKRRKAIWELGQRGDTRAVQPLVDLLIDSDSKQRSLILSTLSEIGTRTLKPMTRALAISLQDENAEVRKNAIRDLTRVYDMVSQISNLLHKATEDSDQDVQETAKWALGQLNRIRSVPSENLPVLKNSISPPENSQ